MNDKATDSSNNPAGERPDYNPQGEMPANNPVGPGGEKKIDTRPGTVRGIYAPRP